MKSSIVIGLAFLLLSACTHRQLSESLWCRYGPVANATFGEEFPNIEVIKLSPDGLSRAMALLSRRISYSITAEGAAAIAADATLNKEVSYYLVRSGLYSDQNASSQQLEREYDSVSRRIFQFRSSDNHLSLINLQFRPVPATLHNYPLLIGTRLNVRSFQAYCEVDY